MSDDKEKLRDHLIAARALIDTPDKWCKKRLECDGAYCTEGAIRKTLGLSLDENVWYESGYFDALMEVLSDQINHQSPWRYNDERRTKHADVMRMFDRAIAST